MAPLPTLPGGTIVVGVDGSEPARRATAFAAELAEMMGAKLEVVTVVKGLAHGAGEGPLDAGQKAKGEDILRGELDRLRFLGVRATKTLLWGEPAEALAEHANRSPNASVLIVGRRGAGNPLLRALAGSVASKMANLAQKPLVIVP
jgi:nucleotide-binding universal stress UspA family protein